MGEEILEDLEGVSLEELTRQWDLRHNENIVVEEFLRRAMNTEAIHDKYSWNPMERIRYNSAPFNEPRFASMSEMWQLADDSQYTDLEYRKNFNTHVENYYALMATSSNLYTFLSHGIQGLLRDTQFNDEDINYNIGEDINHIVKLESAIVNILKTNRKNWKILQEKIDEDPEKIDEVVKQTVYSINDIYGRRLWLDVPEMQDVCKLLQEFSTPQNHSILFLPQETIEDFD